MRTRLLGPVMVATFLLASPGLPAVANPAPPSAPQVIILKLDDVTARGARDHLPVSPRWQRVADYVEKNHLKAGFGIIGFSLEVDNPAYFQWIKDWDRKGIIEFWNHGYRDRKATDKAGEFEQGPAAQQRAALERTQRLAKEKLGLTLRAFGQHYSGVTEETEKALNEVPDNRIWLYGPKDSKFYKKTSLVRVMELEHPIFNPDPEKFRAIYEQRGAAQPMLVLQGHPNQWLDDKKWEGFVKIIAFLKSKGCVFMTPSEYVASLSSNRKGDAVHSDGTGAGNSTRRP
jgi:peptidoglycan/xylan/chitin deacetylase (PgdA/CDA1 family)